MKDIICFDTEWRYNHHEKPNKFNLKCEHILDTLKDFYGLDPKYEKVLSRDNLVHYMKQFNGKRTISKYDIIYMSFHGEPGCIYFEGETKDKTKKDSQEEVGVITLEQLGDLCEGFFEDKIVHFSSCSTMCDEDAVRRFKRQTLAKRVSGYKSDVDPIDSVLLDMAYFKYLQHYTIDTLKRPTSIFQQNYASLIDYLQFVIV